jgi:hypothetical protein
MNQGGTAKSSLHILAPAGVRIFLAHFSQERSTAQRRKAGRCLNGFRSGLGSKVSRVKDEITGQLYFNKTLAA